LVIRSNSLSVECLAAIPTDLDEGSRMDIIKEINLHPYSARIQRSEGSADIMPVSFAHYRYQDCLKLLKIRRLKFIFTASLDGNSGSISEVSILKILKGCAYLRCEKIREAYFLNSQAARETDSYSESRKIKIDFRKEEDLSMEFISASKLKKIVEVENSLMILDVREENELSGKLGHFENSVNIPLGSLRDRISELETMRDREIVTVCRTGVRAATAAEILEREGFGNVKVLAGGMLAWQEIKAEA
jgi:rhodanese-related sulfurtransferase